MRPECQWVALHHLRELCILNTSLEYFHVGSGLESVTELGLLGLKLQFCEQILGHLGHQLVELAIWVEDNMWLDRIFRLCPNLQTFLCFRISFAWSHWR